MDMAGVEDVDDVERGPFPRADGLASRSVVRWRLRGGSVTL